MSDNVYAITELVGTSQKSVEDAIQNAIGTATESLRNLDWFEVVQTRGQIVDGKVGYYQVHLKLGFRYDRSAA